MVGKFLLWVSILLLVSCTNKGLIGVKKTAVELVSSYIESINSYTSSQFLKDIKANFTPADYSEEDVSFVDFKVESVVFNAFCLSGSYANPITTLEGSSSCYLIYLSFTVKKTGEDDKKVQVMVSTSSLKIFIQYSYSETKERYTETIKKVLSSFYVPDNQSYSTKFYDLPSGIKAYFNNYLDSRFSTLAGLELSDYYNQSRLQKVNILPLSFNSVTEHLINVQSNIVDILQDDASIIFYLDGLINKVDIKQVGFDTSVFKQDSGSQFFIDFGLINGLLEAISKINNQSYFYSFFNFVSADDLSKCGSKFKDTDIYDLSCNQVSQTAVPSTTSKNEISITIDLNCYIIERENLTRSLILQLNEVQLQTSFISVINDSGLNFKINSLNLSDSFSVFSEFNLNESCINQLIVSKYNQILSNSQLNSYKALTKDIKAFGSKKLEDIEFLSNGLLLVLN